MHKTRTIGADLGEFTYPYLPYSTYTVASRVRDISRYYAAYEVDNLKDLALAANLEGHWTVGLNGLFDVSGSYLVTGTEEIVSTEFKRPQFNGCTHRKTSGVCKNFTMAGYKDHNINPLYRSIFFPCCYYNVPAGNVLSPLEKHTPYDWSNAQRTAWHVMQPRFEGDISMLNFLLELKDVKSLLRLLKAHPLRKLRNLFRRRRWKLDPSRPIAEAHLFNEFAIKPMLSDIYTITCQIEEHVREAQKKFADAGQGRNSRHWSETNVIDDAALSYGGKNFYYRAIGDAEVQRFTATMEYSYNYSARGSIDAFMRYWGLIPTWEAIWNAIPFGFVVDYIIKIGNSIAAMEKDPNVDVLMTQYCESILSTRTSGYHLVTDECHEGIVVVDGKYRTDPLPLVSGYQSSLFTRRVCNPNKGVALPKVTPMSSRQGLNLAALMRCFF